MQVDELGAVRFSQSKQREFGSWRESTPQCARSDEDVQDARREEVLHQDAAEPLPECVGLATLSLDHQTVLDA